MEFKYMDGHGITIMHFSYVLFTKST